MPQEKLGMNHRGEYRVDLGWSPNGVEGKFKQPRFGLGRDRAQAAIRKLQLTALWDRVCALWQRDRDTPRPLWNEITLQLADALRKGEHVCRLNVPEWVRAADNDPATVAGWLARVREDFKGLSVLIENADSQEQEQGQQFWDERAREFQAQAQELHAHARKVSKVNTSQTLHQALTAWGQHVLASMLDPSGRTTAFGRVKARQIDTLKEHHQDIPLAAFDEGAIMGMVTHWQRRPLAKKTQQPCSPETVKNMIKRVREFVRWLHLEKSFDWRKPADLEFRPVRVARTPAEKSKARHHQVETYTIEELRILYTYATPQERLWLLLALNCSFGNMEIATLQKSGLLLDTQHPFYGIEGSFILHTRFKTGVYGEWQLWGETVEAIKWYQKTQRPKSEESAVFLTREGRLMSDTTEGGHRKQNIPSAWAALIRRVRKDHPEFRALAFKHLRKTAINLVRKCASGELAGIFGMHGEPVSSDALMDVYSDRPFDKVFEAQQLVYSRLAPMFASVPDPFPADWKKSNTKHSKGKIAKAKQLAQEGKKPTEVAKESGLPYQAVLYHCGFFFKSEAPPRKKVSAEQLATIVDLKAQGKSNVEISRLLGIPEATIRYRLKQLAALQGGAEQEGKK